MADDASRGAALSRKLCLPVLKVSSPNFRKQVNEPGSCSTVWLSKDGTTVLKSPLAFHLDGCDDTVVAEYQHLQKESSELLQREKEIYRRLGNHEGVITCLGITDAGLLFPYLKNGNLRHYLRNSRLPKPLSVRHGWIETALKSLAFIHSRGVIQADVSARNFLVTDDLSIVLCDFSGSIIGGKKNLVRPETRYEKVEGTEPVEISVETEVFAVGSLIYEISVGKRPYDEIEDDDEVMVLFRRKTFPSTSNVYLGDTIQRCWLGEFGAVEQTLDTIRKAPKCSNVEFEL